MSEVCNTCGWFRPAHSFKGNCTNPKNCEVKYVGGGGEYNSSEQCLVTPRVQANWGCGWHEEFKRDVIEERMRVEEYPRTPDLQPWESTKWALMPIEREL